MKDKKYLGKNFPAYNHINVQFDGELSIYLEMVQGQDDTNIRLERGIALQLAADIQEYFGVTPKTSELPKLKVGDWVELLYLRENDDHRPEGLNVGSRYIIMEMVDGDARIYVNSYHTRYRIYNRDQLLLVSIPMEEGDEEEDD